MNWKKLWEKIKKWAKETALPWFKTAWVQIVNVLIVLFAYGKFDNAGMAGLLDILEILWC